MPTTTSFQPDVLETGAEGALAALDAVGDKACSLVEAWVQHGNAAAVQEASLRGQGAVRKSARRGLNVLKSRGVPVPKPIRPQAAPKKLVHTAFLLAPDSAGVGIIGICESRAGAAGRACIVYLSEQQGVFRVENLTATPQKLKAQMAKVLTGAGYTPVAVPAEWARYRVAKARAVHTTSGAPEPLGFMSASPLLEPVPTEAPEHPFAEEGLVLAPEDAQELAKDSGALHHLPEFRSWLPSQAAVRELLAAVGARIPAGEQADNEAVGQMLREEMLAATDRFFTPEVRTALVGRMQDAGFSVFQREGESAALKIAATIVVVESCGLTENTPQSVPFLRAFFEKAISYMMAQTGGKLDIPVRRAATAS